VLKNPLFFVGKSPPRLKIADKRVGSHASSGQSFHWVASGSNSKSGTNNRRSGCSAMMHSRYHLWTVFNRDAPKCVRGTAVDL
jgi:hypothetical protein